MNIIKRFSEFRLKWTHLWIRFYLRNVPLDSIQCSSPENVPEFALEQRYQFTKAKYYELFLCAILALRASYALLDQTYWTDVQRQMYYGSYFRVVGAHPFHVEVLCLVWGMNFITVKLMSLGFCRKHFKWLNIILFIEGALPARQLKLWPTESETIQRNGLLMIQLALNGMIFMTVSVFCFMIYHFFLAYSWADFIQFGITWAIFYLQATFLVTKVIYLTNAYVFIISLWMRVKFSRFNQTIMVQPRLRRTFYQSFQQLNNLMQEYIDYNGFWRYFFTLIIFWHVVSLNFLAYVSLFYNGQNSFQLLYMSGLIIEFILTNMMLIQSGSIHSSMARSSTILRQLMMAKKHRWWSIRFELKTINYVELLQRPKLFGQQSIFGRIVYPQDVFIFMREFSIYFFLLASLSNSFHLR